MPALRREAKSAQGDGWKRYYQLYSTKARDYDLPLLFGIGERISSVEDAEIIDILDVSLLEV